MLISISVSDTPTTKIVGFPLECYKQKNKPAIAGLNHKIVTLI